jgi:hypothetical protein
MADPSVLFEGALASLAGYSAFGDKLVKLLKDWREARVQPDNIASAYFRELGDALSKIHAELAKKQIPRIDGTRLNTLLQSFSEKTSKVRGEKVPSSLKGTVSAAAGAAKLLDAWTLDRIELHETQRARLLEDIERAAGKCLALAALLKSGGAG